MSMVHIIGAGLAGLSAAAHLATSGHRVCVYEATNQAGGRCRSYHDPILDAEIDNGNHLLLKANESAFEFLHLIGAADEWQPAGESYEFVNVEYGHRWQLKAPYWLPKLPLTSYLSLLRLLIAGKRTTVGQCISKRSQLYQRFVEPICISALNTHPDDASAAMFRSMLLTIQRFGKDGALPYVAQLPFQQSIIGPAIDYLKAHQAEIYYRKRLTDIEYENDSVSLLRFTDQTVTVGPDDYVIMAIPAASLEKLIPNMSAPKEYESIINGHFSYESSNPSTLIGLTGGMAEWIFIKDGIVSTTTSAANRYEEMDQDEIANQLWRDVKTALTIDEEVPDHRIVTEKRATFRATPDQLTMRPAMKTDHPNLLLAGDYTDTDLPATIEGSILSGKRAADAITLAS